VYSCGSPHARGGLWTFGPAQAQIRRANNPAKSRTNIKSNGCLRQKTGAKLREHHMTISRRDVLLGGAAALGAASFSFPAPAIAQSETIKIGCLAAMTGPSSAPTIGFNRGVNFAVEAINAAGGVKGRKFEVIMRDTQGDPTKAVNATQEMISQLKVHGIWGPLNSGEALATTPIMARAKLPNIHPCVVETLIDVAKYPNAFRMAPSNSQWDDAVRNYCLNILKVKKVAVIGDTPVMASPRSAPPSPPSRRMVPKWSTRPTSIRPSRT